jgi:site-specific recombinase XerD
LIIKLLYGTGMRLMECLRLRVKDVDFGSGGIVVSCITTLIPKQLRPQKLS